MSAANSSAYVVLEARRFEPSELTRGPWDPGHQHGGPPSALLARAFERRQPWFERREALLGDAGDHLAVEGASQVRVPRRLDPELNAHHLAIVEQDEVQGKPGDGARCESNHEVAPCVTQRAQCGLGEFTTHGVDHHVELVT